MRKIIPIILLISNLLVAQNAWINEFHYENTGSSDIGEFVEVAIQNVSSFTLSEFRISLYNGSDNKRYDTYHNLSGFTQGSTVNGITFFSKQISGIQNGDPDGICLDYDGTVLHFISYEGAITATDGVAAGETSIDIGVSESSSTPIGSSLGLEGSGTDFTNFTWTVFTTATPGFPNDNQPLPVELVLLTTEINENNIDIIWQTETEVNNYGFEIERKSETKNWNQIGFVEGHGNSNSPKYYTYSDNSVNASGKYSYRLKQIDINGTFEYSKIVEVIFTAPKDFELTQNYPNPFNPETSIQFNLPIDANVKLSVFNVLGEEVVQLINGFKSAGIHNVTFDGGSINSGIYFYKIEANNFMQIRKMILQK
ncbi:MAG: T9SS type A sorting domain-containing protein [Ignavibacteriales bacterium]|nr:T9SS type A sorting domain-containing protein [Ignavibacteriales bacterium]